MSSVIFIQDMVSRQEYLFDFEVPVSKIELAFKNKNRPRLGGAYFTLQHP